GRRHAGRGRVRAPAAARAGAGAVIRGRVAHLAAGRQWPAPHWRKSTRPGFLIRPNSFVDKRGRRTQRGSQIEELKMARPFFDSFLDELEARTEIGDTLKRFVRGIDRKDWALALSTYHDDAVDEHGFFNGRADKFLEIVAQKHEHQHHSMHVISNMLIEF